MVRLRSNVMTIFVASALVLFMSRSRALSRTPPHPRLPRLSLPGASGRQDKARPRTSRTTLRRVQTPT